jgi:hypothetical protein
VTDLTAAKPGDTLFIYTRWKKWIAKVDRVTPTGRVILQNGTQFNPNGDKRGESGWDRAHARIASDDDLASINRDALVRKLTHFPWHKLDAENLKKIGTIIADAKLKE